MKLLRCYIESFGTLSCYSREFSPALDCEVRENGWGKSTLLVFIKAMLYGLPQTKHTSLLQNERKRYTPWQGGSYGGYLEFEKDGKEYRVQRFFGASGKGDSLSLYDVASGKLLPLPEKELGEWLFGINAEGFERTVYISQRYMSDDDTAKKTAADEDRKRGNTSVAARINAAVDEGGNMGSYDNAMSLLNTKRQFYAKTGDRGAIADTKREIEALHMDLDECKKCQSLAEQLNSERMEKEREAFELFQRAEELRRRGDDAAKRGELDALSKRRASIAEGVKSSQVRVSCAEAELPNIEKSRKLCDEAITLSKAATELQSAMNGFTERREKLEKADALDADAGRFEMASKAARMRGRIDELSAKERNGIEAERLKAQALELRAEADRYALTLRMLKSKLRIEELERGFAADREAYAHSCAAAKRTRLMLLILLIVVTAALVACGLLVHPYMFIGAGVCAALAVAILFVFKPKLREKPEEPSELIRLRFEYKDLCMNVGMTPSLDSSGNYAEMLSEREREKRESADKLDESVQGLDIADDADKSELGQLRDEYKALTLNAGALMPSEVGINYADAYESEARKCRQGAEALREEAAAITDVADPVEHSDELARLCREYDEKARVLGINPGGEIAKSAELKTKASYLSSDLRAAKESFKKYSEELAAFDVEHGELPELTGEVEDAGELRRLEKNTRDEGDVVREKAQRLLRKEEVNMEIAGNAAQITMDIAELEERQKSYDFELSVVSETQNLLRTAKTELSSRYLGSVGKAFFNYINRFSPELASKLSLDADFGTQFEQGGKLTSCVQLSTGLRELVDVCARFALTDAMYEKEKPFMLLDDPFANLDDVNLAEAMSLLRSLAKERQIIYFSCSNSRNNI